MTDKQLTNRVIYFLIALLNLLIMIGVAGMGAGTLVGFRTGEPFAPYSGQFVVIFSTLGATLTTWLSAHRGRLGSEGLTAQVDALQKEGVPRGEMAVVPAEDLTLLRAEADRIRRIKPLRAAAAADETLERAGRG